MKYPTQERLKELFNYCPETGLLTRKVTKTYNAKKGSAAGSLNKSNGYLAVAIDGRTYCVHKIIWLHVFGGHGDHQVDHRDGNRINNKIKNLHIASQQKNMMNKSMQSNNKSNITGVRWTHALNKYRSVITVKGKVTHLGVFNTIFDAACARISAQNKMGFTKRHGR